MRPQVWRGPAFARLGFTLLEVLAVVLLTSMVIGVALNQYVNLSRATVRASSHSAGVRRAVALLDRIARDFESAILVATPPETDPFDQRWIFSGEQRYSELGADQLKFITRAHRPRSSAGHESDLETVVYCLRNAEDGETYDLLRWSSPQLPEAGSDLRDLPCDEADARLLADRLYDFGVVFLDEYDDVTRQWDSSQLVDSSQLPQAVRIEVAFADDLPNKDPFADAPRTYQRTVPIRVHPLDMEELGDPTSPINGGTGEEDLDDEEDAGGPCEQSPCAGQTACAVIQCADRIGSGLGATLEGILEAAQKDKTPFCAWRRTQGRQVRDLLISNPACR